MMWDGKHPADPLFRETCMGQFLEMAIFVHTADDRPAA